jgi:endonuclease/exonuclease/phosphatase family metal-dependent hydrolase
VGAVRDLDVWRHDLPMRRLVLPAAVFAVVAACGNHSLPLDRSIESHAHGPPAAKANGRLRIVTYNIHMISADKLVEALRADPQVAAADVVALQEVESHPKEGQSRACLAAQELDLHCAFAPGYGLDDGGSHGVALLSRWPLADLEVIELPYHDLHYNSARRVALGATIEAGGGVPLRVYAVHLDNRINPAARKQQLAPVLDAAERTALPVLIAGDMNTSPFVWVTGFIPVPAGVQDERLEKFVRSRGFDTPVTDSGPTSPWLAMRLDAVYTRGVAVKDHGVAIDVRASDHLPLWADVVVDDVTCPSSS